MDLKTKSLANLVSSFDKLDVLVIGEAMLDSYLEGNTGRICREAPVPVVTLSSRTDAPGGAANTAVNVRSLGANVRFLSVIGNDDEGERLRKSLETCGVATDYLLIQTERQTLAKNRVIAAGQMLVRFDQGSTEPVASETEQLLLQQLEKCWESCQAVIISDYGYGILTTKIIEGLTRLQQQAPRIVVVDSKHLPTYREMKITACKPNYEETLQLFGAPILRNTSDRVEAIINHQEHILEQTGAQMVAVTLDVEGALLLERNQPPYRTYAQPSPSSRTAGAGDTFVSALALALAAGSSSTEAAEIASAAAAIVVAKDGTAACEATELREYYLANDRYLPDLERLAARVESYRRQKQRIVFANGCFDILHRGHIALLNQAKELGDVLIVAVNSDASVRQLKGANRPINTLEDRIQVLAALSCIDHLIAFDDLKPDALIEALKPDIFVKGGDYSLAMIPEAALVERNGGSVHILPYLPDRSTHLIIERIQAQATETARSNMLNVSSKELVV